MEDKWDPQKRERCLTERGIDFEKIYPLLDLNNVRFTDEYVVQTDFGEEERFNVGVVVEGRLCTVVLTWRNGIHRIVTAWPSSRKERNEYHERIKATENRPPS
jgi:uncharacterized DUF497 family protein